jgi:choline dehydrogenase-like flavoprotein
LTITGNDSMGESARGGRGPPPASRGCFSPQPDASLGTGLIPGQPHNWSFTGRLTPDLPYPVVRGKILGGSTAVNGAYFIRARKHDFDRWVAEGNDESYEKSLPYYLKSENDLTYGDTELHNSQGPIPVHRETRNPARLTTAFFEAAAELGFPEDVDKNGEGKHFTDHPDVPFGWKPRRRPDEPDLQQFIESALVFTSDGSDVEGDLEIMPTRKPFGRLLLGRSATKGVAAVLCRPLQTLKSLKGSSIKRLVQQALHRDDIVFTLVIEREDARGTLRIVSADPHVQPELEFNYLSTERDRARMRRMIRTVVALLRTEAFTPSSRSSPRSTRRPSPTTGCSMPGPGRTSSRPCTRREPRRWAVRTTRRPSPTSTAGSTASRAYASWTCRSCPTSRLGALRRRP